MRRSKHSWSWHSWIGIIKYCNSTFLCPVNCVMLGTTLFLSSLFFMVLFSVKGGSKDLPSQKRIMVEFSLQNYLIPIEMSILVEKPSGLKKWWVFWPTDINIIGLHFSIIQLMVEKISPACKLDYYKHSQARRRI